MYLFLCGYPKSGTTLLLSLLDGHPEQNVFPEELKFVKKVMQVKCMRSKKESVLRRTGAVTPSLGRVEYPSGVRDYSDIDGSHYIQELRKRLNMANSDKEIMDAIFMNWKQFSSFDTNKIEKYRVEKTPKNEYYISELKDIFDGARFLYVVRDPRDNFLSYQKKKKSLTIDRFIQDWRASVESVESLHAGEVFIVKYEDLVSKPKCVMNGICSFLDIKFTNSLLSPTRNSFPWGGNSMFDQNSDRIHAFATGRYKKFLSNDAIRCIESELHDYLVRYNYNLHFQQRM
jgi:hypothetical protein